MEKPSLFLMTPFINWPPTQQPAECKRSYTATGEKRKSFNNPSYIHNFICSTTYNYRGPWCKNERQSWSLDENMKYLPDPASLLRRSTILSISRIAANKTAAPWRRIMGVKITGRGIFRAALGVPWYWSPIRSHFKTQKTNIPLIMHTYL